MIEPGKAIERPGEGGYFAALNLPAAGGVEAAGGASSAAGTDSSASSNRTATSAMPGAAASRKPARTTANR